MSKIRVKKRSKLPSAAHPSIHPIWPLVAHGDLFGMKSPMTELRPTNTRRWVARHKAAVVAAVSSGMLTIEEEGRRYHMSELGTDGSQTHRWRRQSRANPSLETRNSLLAGKIQEIHRFWPLTSEFPIECTSGIRDLRSKFPVNWNREIIVPEQGIKSADQGSVSPDQGRLSGSGQSARTGNGTSL